MRFILIPLFFIYSLVLSQTITESEFEEKISEDIVVVEFYAEWNKDNCVDLKEFKDVASYMVNIEECPNLVEVYEILSVPTILVFNNKEVVERYDADLTFKLSIKDAKKKVEELVLKKFM
jgi:thiol-disulfide isomerase/thioredoxin